MTGAVWNCTEILTQIDFVKELVLILTHTVFRKITVKAHKSYIH